MTINPPTPRPCESCPYRRDVPSGVWSRDEYETLPLYDEDFPVQPLELFQCHQTDRSSDKARLCSGWVGCHGEDLISLRLAVATGKLPYEGVLDYTTDVPLFDSGAQAAEHGIAEIEHPSEEACNLVAKIASVRPDVEFH